MSIFKTVTPDQFPKEYTANCPDGIPSSIDDIVQIHKSPVNGTYDIEDKLYAVWCWATFRDHNFKPVADRLRVPIDTLRNWCRQYAEPEYLEYTSLKAAQRQDKINGPLDIEAIERLMAKALRVLNKKIKTAGPSQLAVIFGILGDKRDKILKEPKRKDDSEVQDRLAGLSDEAVKKILEIIEKDGQPEDAEFRVIEDRNDGHSTFIQT